MRHLVHAMRGQQAAPLPAGAAPDALIVCVRRLYARYMPGVVADFELAVRRTPVPLAAIRREVRRPAAEGRLHPSCVCSRGVAPPARLCTAAPLHAAANGQLGLAKGPVVCLQDPELWQLFQQACSQRLGVPPYPPPVVQALNTRFAGFQCSEASAGNALHCCL